MAAGDNVIMGGDEQQQDVSEGADGQAQSQGDSPDGRDAQQQQQEQMPMDAEQEYAHMDYRICGELSKYGAAMIVFISTPI